MRFSFSVHKEPVFGSLFECAAIIGELSKILVRSRFAVSTQLLIDRSYSRNPSSRPVVVSATCLNSLRARRSLRSGVQYISALLRGNRQRTRVSVGTSPPTRARSARFAILPLGSHGQGPDPPTVDPGTL